MCKKKENFIERELKLFWKRALQSFYCGREFRNSYMVGTHNWGKKIEIHFFLHLQIYITHIYICLQIFVRIY